MTDDALSIRVRVEIAATRDIGLTAAVQGLIVAALVVVISALETGPAVVVHGQRGHLVVKGLRRQHRGDEPLPRRAGSRVPRNQVLSVNRNRVPNRALNQDPSLGLNRDLSVNHNRLPRNQASVDNHLRNNGGSGPRRRGIEARTDAKSAKAIYLAERH